MVDAIVSLAVEKLTSFIAQEVTLLQGVRGEIEWLRDELRTMRSFLRDADNKQGGNDLIRQWVSDIRDVSYDAEDILDSLMIDLEEDKAQESCFMGYLQACASICKKPTNLHNIGKEIESLKKKVSDISRRRQDYGITNIGGSGEGTSRGPDNRLVTGPISLRRTTSLAEDYVIGFEDVKKILLSELVKEGSSHSIVSIYGMGGLGKTTLARKLYNSMNVVHHFDYQAWICVSQEYNIKDLLQRIIKSFKGQPTKEELDMLGTMVEEDLKRYLYNFLKGHLYLVVIDDVWHEDAFRTLKEAFPDNGNGSRIIITTRSEKVARRAHKGSFVHKLRFLTRTESWDLFCKKAFEGDSGVNSCSSAMKTIAEEMVEKCSGLPLAIVVLAGLLSYNYGLEEWLKVKADIWQNLKKDSMEISELLTLSYNDLASEIKLCFLYVGIFPEDHVFRVSKFIRLLIAEDFIPRGNEAMEEVADKFVNELINRNLLQAVDTSWEETATCKVHDLIRDLAIEMAKEVNLFTIFDFGKKSNSTFTQPRRYAIHSQGEDGLSLDHSNRKIRALLFFAHRHQQLVEGIVSTCMKLKLLRVLELEGVELSKSTMIAERIGELIHLRFLGLSYTNILNIPPSIGNLKRLQTLEVFGYFPCNLPHEMCKLKELRHLHGTFQGGLHIESLTNLQTLSTLDSQQLSELNSTKLSNLQELFLGYLDDSSSLLTIINLDNLGTLVLLWLAASPPLKPLFSCKRLVKLSLSGPILKDPILMEFPPLLTRLILVGSKLVNDPMPVLESLPNLTSLELIDDAYVGKKMVCSSNGFRQLQVLRISNMCELEEWEVEERAMPLIKGLRVHECNKLRMIPERLKLVSAVGSSMTPYCAPYYYDFMSYYIARSFGFQMDTGI